MIILTHNYWQLATSLLNTTKIILPLTLPHVAHFRLYSERQCTMSSQPSLLQIWLLGLCSAQSWHECLTKHLDIQDKALPWWSCEEIQSKVLHTRGQTERRYRLFWDLGSCCPMIHSTDSYDLGYQHEINLHPMQHNSSFHPWTGHWNYLCPSTTRLQSWEGRWSPSPQTYSLWSPAITSIFLSLSYWTPHKQGLMALQFDPCLFISKLLIVIIYVDDIDLS